MPRIKTRFSAFYVPPGIDIRDQNINVLEFGSGDETISLQSLEITPSLASDIIVHLRRARKKHLLHMTVDDILDSIDKTTRLWKDPDYPLRNEAEAMLSIITGFSTPMIRATLDGLVSMFNAKDLKLLLEDELGDPRLLDQFRPRSTTGGYYKAYGHELITAVFAGNVPGLPVGNIVYALLTKSAILGKSSSEEPLFASLFAQSLADVNPQLADCLAMVCWKGGEQSIEQVAFGAADAVIAYGSEHSVNQIQKRIPGGTRFISYGHKISLGIIGKQALSMDRIHDTTEKAARDVSIFDQQACLSPQLFYVEQGGDISPEEFAKLLAHQMMNLNRSIPRGKVSVNEAATINQLRGSYEFKQAWGQDVAVYASTPGTDWTVIYEADPSIQLSPLNRFIRVKPVTQISHVMPLIEPIKDYLQTVGAALPSDRLLTLANQIGELGVDRICPLGQMCAPSLFWRHDGRLNLMDLIRWTEIEKEPGTD